MFSPNNITLKEVIAVRVVADIALMVIILKQILKGKTKGSARFLRFILKNKLDEFLNSSTMKKMKILAIPMILMVFLSSCTSIQVLSDYDRATNFNEYKSYAFYKTGIDKVQISDFDKKRILRAIETELGVRGFVKSDSPDILVSIFTKEREQIDVYNNYWGGGYGWGWGPYYYGGWGPGWGGSTVSTSTEGSLYIDLIDTKKRELIWQGKGVGTLGSSKNIEKKEARIQEFVSEILQQYPPNAIASK